MPTTVNSFVFLMIKEIFMIILFINGYLGFLTFKKYKVLLIGFTNIYITSTKLKHMLLVCIKRLRSRDLN